MLGDATAIAGRVAEILRDRIVKGDLKPSQRLVERRLSAEFGISRTPVREALKLLDADGLIEISRNRGAQVTAYRGAEAKDLFGVIAVLEGLAAELLAARIDAGSMAHLERLHAQMLDHHASGRHDEYFDLNSVIHDFIVVNAGSPALLDTHKRLIARARRGRYLAIMDPARLAQAVSEHEGLMAALRAGDPSGAARIWRQHLMHTGETLAAVLEQVQGQTRDHRSSATA